MVVRRDQRRISLGTFVTYKIRYQREEEYILCRSKYFIVSQSHSSEISISKYSALEKVALCLLFPLFPPRLTVFFLTFFFLSFHFSSAPHLVFLPSRLLPELINRVMYLFHVCNAITTNPAASQTDCKANPFEKPLSGDCSDHKVDYVCLE